MSNGVTLASGSIFHKTLTKCTPCWVLLDTGPPRAGCCWIRDQGCAEVKMGLGAKYDVGPPYQRLAPPTLFFPTHAHLNH